MASVKHGLKNQASGGGRGKHSSAKRKAVKTRASVAQTIKEALKKENPLAQLKNSKFINKKLDKLKKNILATDDKGNFKMSNAEFNKQVVSHAVKKLQDARKAGIMEGGVMRLPKQGKLIVVGDLHEQATNLTAILAKAQLDKNPNTKIILLGDIVSGSKTSDKDETGGGDSMHRVISWLQARYPDQVFAVNGNHEMGMMAGVEKMKGGSKASKALGRMEARNFSDKQQVISRIKESPLIIQIGDKAKGEYTRTFQHSPGNSGNTLDINSVAKLDTPEKRFAKATNVFEGKKLVDKQSMEELNKQNKSDMTYFGHISPEIVAKGINDGSVKPLETNGVVAKFKGGGTFVDSQTKKSGIVEINLDKDSAPEKIVSLNNLRKDYKAKTGHLEGLREFGGSDKDTILGRLAHEAELKRQGNSPEQKKQVMSEAEQAKLLADLMATMKGTDW